MRVYGQIQHYGWEDCGSPGTVVGASPNGIEFSVELDDGAFFLTAHRKQCRRLKPRKKPREWLMVVKPDGEVVKGHLSENRGVGPFPPNEIVTVREVLK